PRVRSGDAEQPARARNKEAHRRRVRQAPVEGIGRAARPSRPTRAAGGAVRAGEEGGRRNLPRGRFYEHKPTGPVERDLGVGPTRWRKGPRDAPDVEP